MSEEEPRRRVLRGALVAAGLLLALLAAAFCTSIGRDDLRLTANTVFCDRAGRELRFLPDAAGERHLFAPLAEIPPLVRQAFLAAEDERFYAHGGFDAVAILRAVKDNLRQGRVVSGASTITQQLVRQIFPHRRSYWQKALEIVRAARLEMLLSKDQILEQYLNRVPLGNNLRGVPLAARVYFGKTPAQLTAAEAAVLAALPKAPGDLNPLGPGRSRLLARQHWVLERMAEIGALTPAELAEASRAEPRFQPAAFPFAAPHLVDLLLERGVAGPGVQTTTLDLPLQQAAEKILASHRARLAYRGASQAAALVIHNPTMAVVASVGSLAYAKAGRGFNNGTTALRSPGSTLKPLLYGLALDAGFPTTLQLEDTLRRYRTPQGDYAPLNYDRREYGPVTMRTALANSLNISAIRLLEAVGQERFYHLLQRVDLINSPELGSDHYGLGLVLGNPEVSLEELAAAYAMLANGGAYRPLRYLEGDPVAPGEPVITPQAAYIIGNILADPSARLITFGTSEALNFPFPVALKTGTSTRYRDAWIVGFTPEYTVAVWTGNFPGNPTFNLAGASGAGPIFRDLISLLYRHGTPAPRPAPEGVVAAEVCGISGMRPGPHCRYRSQELFIAGREPVEVCSFHRHEAPVHELPTRYAAWLHDRQRQDAAGGYRLAGQATEPQPFAPIVWDEQLPSATGIRPHNLAGKPAPAPRPVVTGHLSIGAAPDEPAGDAEVQIRYPLPGDRFVSDGGGRFDLEAIKLEAEVSGAAGYVDWFVDGLPFQRVGPPYAAYWKPQKGRHRISVAAPNGQGDVVEIRVE